MTINEITRLRRRFKLDETGPVLWWLARTKLLPGLPFRRPTAGIGREPAYLLHDIVRPRWLKHQTWAIEATQVRGLAPICGHVRHGQLRRTAQEVVCSPSSLPL